MTSHYSELSPSDIKTTTKALMALDIPFDLSANKVKIMSMPLVFSNGWVFIICENYESVPFEYHYFLCDSDGNHHGLSYTPNPYNDNGFDRLNISVDASKVEGYLSFYLSLFQTQFGRLMPINHVDDIKWREDLPLVSRQSLEKEIQSYPRIKDVEKGDDGFFVTLACLYQSSLVEVDINVTPNGHVTINRIQSLIDDLPVLNFS